MYWVAECAKTLKFNVNSNTFRVFENNACINLFRGHNTKMTTKERREKKNRQVPEQVHEQKMHLEKDTSVL